ncbi:hypothetical protein ACMFMG_011075 [Clarireedia jacksonii]
MAKQTLFQCSVPGCGRVLATKAGIKHHEKLTHKEELSICPYCAKKLKLIGQHVNRVHQINRRVPSRRCRRKNAYPLPTIIQALPSPLHLAETTSPSSSRNPSPAVDETEYGVADFDTISTSTNITSIPPSPIIEHSQGLEQTLSLPYFDLDLDLETQHYLKLKIEPGIGYIEDDAFCTYNTTPPPYNFHLIDQSLPNYNPLISNHTSFIATSFTSSYSTSNDCDEPLPSIEPPSPTWTYDSPSLSPTPSSSRSLSPSVSPQNYNRMIKNSPSPSMELDDLLPSDNDDDEDIQYTLACIEYKDVYDICGSSVWL